LVEGHDGLSARPDGGGENVAIIGVGKNKAVDELLKTGYHAVGDGAGHQLTRALESLGFQFGAVFENVAEALVEDRGRPARAHDAGVRGPHEDISKRGRVEHASVVEDDDRHRALITEAVLLCFGGELVEYLLALGFVALLVRGEISRLHATVRSNLPGWNLSFVEQRDQERPRDVQEVGGLLRRQLGVNGNDGDGVAVRHLAEDLQEQFERIARDRCGDRTAFGVRTNLNRSR
jgi:hypothetical protein